MFTVTGAPAASVVCTTTGVLSSRFTVAVKSAAR
jgi:hypothetical protein